MKIAVIGAGTIGSAVAYNLAKHDTVKQVIVCDARPGALDELSRRVQSPKLQSYQVDARDHNVLGPIVRNSGCMISCLTPEFNLDLARLAISLGIHYCDLGGNEGTVAKILKLHDTARQKAVWIVPNCGLAPGLVNILCMYGIEQFDEVETAHLRVGDVPPKPTQPFNFVIPFSAKRLVDRYTQPVTLIDEGELTYYDPLTGIEPIQFDAPYDNLEAFYSAASLSTLPNDLLGRVKRLDFKTIAYPGHAHQMGFAIALGLCEPRKIDVRTHMTYKDVFVRRLQRLIPGDRPDVVLFRVLITGLKDDRKQSFIAELVETYKEADDITAMKYITAVSAAVVAMFLLSHQIPGGGAAPPESIVPKDLFLQALRDHGLNISTRWAKGYADVETGE